MTSLITSSSIFSYFLISLLILALVFVFALALVVLRKFFRAAGAKGHAYDKDIFTDPRAERISTGRAAGTDDAKSAGRYRGRRKYFCHDRRAACESERTTVMALRRA